MNTMICNKTENPNSADLLTFISTVTEAVRIETIHIFGMTGNSRTRQKVTFYLLLTVADSDLTDAEEIVHVIEAIMDTEFIEVMMILNRSAVNKALDEGSPLLLFALNKGIIIYKHPDSLD